MKLPADVSLIRRRLPLGEMVLAATPHGAAGAWFSGQKHEPDWSQQFFLNEIDDTSAKSGHRLLLKLERWLVAYHQGCEAPVPALDLSAGTPFQQSVWRALLQIPSGQTWSYSQLAAHLGCSSAVRAVAAAVGRNPLSIVVPCHRVVGASGALTGYAGGLERKRALLAHEAAVGRHLQS